MLDGQAVIRAVSSPNSPMAGSALFGFPKTVFHSHGSHSYDSSHTVWWGLAAENYLIWVEE